MSLIHNTIEMLRSRFHRSVSTQPRHEDIIYRRKTESAWDVLQDEEAAAEVCRDVLARAEEFVAKHSLLRQMSTVRFRTIPHVVTVGEICAGPPVSLYDYMETAMFDLARVILGREENPLYQTWLFEYVSPKQPFNVHAFENLRNAVGAGENQFLLVDRVLWDIIVSEPKFVGLYASAKDHDDILRGELGSLSGVRLLTDSYRIPGMRYIPSGTGFMVNIAGPKTMNMQLPFKTGGTCVPMHSFVKFLAFDVAYAEPTQYLRAVPYQ